MTTMVYVTVMCDGCGEEADMSPTRSQARESAKRDGYVRKEGVGQEGGLGDLCPRCAALPDGERPSAWRGINEH